MSRRALVLAVVLVVGAAAMSWGSHADALRPSMSSATMRDSLAILGAQMATGFVENTTLAQSRTHARPSAVPTKAVAFDLLTALIDSWPLWIEIAGEDELGRAWRLASLKRVTSAGMYEPYEAIVIEAARDVGLAAETGELLISCWDRLRPWPEAPAVLAQVKQLGLQLAIVTNCSQRLAERSAAATGVKFDVVMSAERAGFYKIDPRAYQAALNELRLEGPEVLFVAGSAHDVPGAGALAMPVYWVNRQDLPVPDGAPPPVANEATLDRLPAVVKERMSGAGR